jgi:general secretion pathway protein A
VDEAQNLSPQMLEEIRLLTNLETSTEKLLQIVLAGQPELEGKLNQPQMRQLRQRITLRAKTLPLTLEETRGYINERLRIAGSDGSEVFSTGAIEAIHQYARGIPRVTNVLSEHALISAFVDQRKPVPREVVDEVAHDFELLEVDPASQAMAAAQPLNGIPAGGVPLNGNHPPLVESLLQALNALVERLNNAEINVEPERERETEKEP